MIHIKYKELFDIELLHAFYTSGRTNDVRLTPTTSSALLFRQYGLRFLPTPSGGKLFARVTENAGTDFINLPLPPGTKFSFLLEQANPYFENFTELPLTRPATSYYYFNNLINNLSAVGSPLLVADTTGKIAGAADLLPFRFHTFSYEHTSGAPVQTGLLHFIDTGETFEQILQNQQDRFNFSFDLANMPTGRATFSVEGDVKTTAFLAGSNPGGKIFGIVEIFFRTSLPDAYQFQFPDDSIETKHFKIAFGNRQTRWRYFISRKYNSSVTGVQVEKTNGAPIAFTAQPAGVGHFIMTSNSFIPLKELPVTGIRLTDQASKVIIANLPNPALGLVNQEGTDLYSDILITI